MKLLGISGTIVGRKTSASLTQFLNMVKQNHTDIDIELLDLNDYKLEFCDGRKLNDYNEDTQQVVKTIKNADAYVIGSPVFQASIPGTLKNVFDLLPPDVFKGKVVGLLMNGGTEKHYLTMEYQLKPIVSYLKAHVPPNNVFLHTSDFDENNQVTDLEMVERLKDLADELIIMSTKLKK
ncbi:NADPH-dependent FMN reductase [Cytobacillus sp. FJAT-54145]|uniref:NADPH-dependent FMN reductase n=1 Tax=Cytobacillus spartinae TaxID=3299023 RepID=A0ABW6KFL5_9BACI